MWCWITDHHHCQNVKLTWTITHCLGLGHETMMSAVCLSIFLLFSIACIYIQCCNYYRGLWNHNRHPIPHPNWWSMRSIMIVLENIDHTVSGSNEMFFDHSNKNERICLVCILQFFNFNLYQLPHFLYLPKSYFVTCHQLCFACWSWWIPFPEVSINQRQLVKWEEIYCWNTQLLCNIAFNSLAPGKFEWNFRHVIFKQILVINGWGISCEIALIRMSLDFTDDQSILVQVIAWCHQATSHYLSQLWPRSLSPYGVIRPQWVKG